MRIYLVRHGKPKVLNNNFYEARLSEEAQKQAEQLALSGKLLRPDRVFSSPYKRTIDTAMALCQAFNTSFEVMDFLKEWNLQSLNLQDPEFTLQTENGWRDQKFRVAGDESLEDVRKRAYEGLMKIATSLNVNSVVLVTHGTLMEMLCSLVAGRPAQRGNIESVKFLEYAILEFNDKSFKVIKDIV